MKNKLYVAGLVLISLLTYSCSNDEDSYEVQGGVKASEIKTAPQSILKIGLIVKPIDSTAVKINMEMSSPDGDPSIPKLPR